MKIENYLSTDKYPNVNSSDDKNYYKSNCEFSDLTIDEIIKFDFREKRIIFKYNKASLNSSYKTEKNNAVISHCIFKNNVYIESLNQSITFIDCIFEKKLFIGIKQKDLTEIEKKLGVLEEPSEVRLAIDNCDIHDLDIENAIIKSKFYINKQSETNQKKVKILKLSIKNTIFEENFKLHNCEVDTAEIEDTDFKKNADFFKSEFIQGTLKKNQEENIEDGYIGFKAINFEGLALFGDTKFHKKLIFKYVTFKGHNHFKSAILEEGLDLEYTNIQQEMNFYGINIVDTSKTSQETYRIIKNQFEKLNNKIEANKYHALELEQKRKELEENKSSDWREKWVFRFHDWSSKHSTNWFRALWLILIVGFVTIFLVHFEIVKDLFFHPYHFKIEYIFKIWNEFWQYINITNLEKLKDKPFIFFLNKVSLGYLYYQFLTAVRKDTRK